MAHTASGSEVQLDYCLPLRPAIATIATSGFGLALVCEFAPLPAGLSILGMVLVGLAASAWLLSGRTHQVSRWIVVASAILAVLGLAAALSAPSALSLLAVPLALTTALISSRAALWLSVPLISTLILPWSPWFIADPTARALCSLSVLSSFALAYAVCQQVRRKQAWLEDYYGRRQQQLEETRGRIAKLEQNRADWEFASRQLALANERLAELRLSAERAREEKADFVAKVSHEFRTPLNVIIGMIGLMVEAPQAYGARMPQKARQHLDIVHRNCQHLASMIDDVLDLSQADAGKMSLRRTLVDLRHVAETALDVVRPLAQGKGLSLGLELPSDVPPTYCDGVRIRQVILNLLSNAVRYTDRGSVCLCLQVVGMQVRIGVRDTGPGIPADEVERIFEPFGRSSQSILRGQSGSGLGLTISRELVEMHGGHMWVETALGSGSAFYFELPISAPAPLDQSAGGQIREDWLWRQRSSWADLSQVVSKQRIIVCDTGRSLEAALHHYEDRAELLYVRDLAAASRALQVAPAHALLLASPSAQALLPEMVNARTLMPGTPIVGCCWSAEQERQANPSVIGWLTKPVSKEQLARAISKASGQIRTVVVADDDADTREWLRTMLVAQDPTMDVRLTDRGAMALTLLRERRPDLLLLDVVMPGMDGWQVLAQINADASLRGTPVIMISAGDVLEKPVRSGMVMATMEGGLSAGVVLSLTGQLSSVMLGAD